MILDYNGEEGRGWTKWRSGKEKFEPNVPAHLHTHLQKPAHPILASFICLPVHEIRETALEAHNVCEILKRGHPINTVTLLSIKRGTKTLIIRKVRKKLENSL